MDAIEVTKIDDNNYIVKGKINTESAPILAEELAKREYNKEDLVIDFSNVHYISSSGLRVLLMEQKKMKDNNNVVLMDVNDIVKEIFSITGFDELLTFRKSE